MAEINTTQMRDALAWATNEQKTEEEIAGNPWEWFWQAVQGDFDENRSTGQIVLDAAISMIPLVDQVCDVRDLIANCKKLREDVIDKWAWIALVLTLIGLFPFLGSLVKGVLKVFFAFVRRASGQAIESAVDNAMTWVITLLRRESFQRYLHQHKVDEVFSWLSQEIKAIKSKIRPNELIQAFDAGIRTLRILVAKVELIPTVGPKAKKTLEIVLWVRSRAQEGMTEVIATIDSVMNNIAHRLERETLKSRQGIVNVSNVHYRGTLPESTAISLMRTPHPRPGWLNEGTKLPWRRQKYKDVELKVAEKVQDGWPPLNEDNIKSFHKMETEEIKGPARLYRIVSPNSRAMSDCWISEEVFKKIQNSPHPREAWRKYLAVWPDWNANGQFVIFDIKPGESMKVWRGPASSQTKDNLANRYLEGGWEQIVFNVARNDPRNDIMLYYRKTGSNKDILNDAIDQNEYNKLDELQRKEYTGIREAIKHPSINGPFETGWGYIDFNGSGLEYKIGLPSLPGQLTTLRK
ncbi:hypothetical protein [Massilia niastensis]|uniref:hypothetical protein n=1 Tax=Massilia niastensis TaxID=544911 RepID=UPI0003A949E4|nr:hypothetical protein [Massilia niastensis]